MRARQALRILQVCPGFPPDRTGGVENYVSSLTTSLRHKNHEVWVLTKFWNKTISEWGILQKRTPSNQVVGSFYWAMTTRVSTILGCYDIVHCHGLEGYILAAQPFLSVPTVVHVHNTAIPDRGFYGGVEHKAGLIVFRESLRRASRIIIPTEAAGRKILRDFPFVDTSKIRTVPNMVDTAFYNPRLVVESRRPPISEDDVVVLYFGKVKRSKGIEDICKAYRLIAKGKIKLVVAGAPTATTRFFDYLKSQYPEVIFTGRVRDPREWYARADAFCIYTNGFEGGETFSIALAEAMSMGLPVVCADNPVYREVTHGNAVFVEPNNPKALSEALSDLASNSHLRFEMGAKGRDVAVKNYEVERVISQVESIYGELSEGNGRNER